MDTSLSTESWVANQRVIDIARETALLFCHALDAGADPHAVYSFTSRGRHDVRVNAIKEFAEHLSPTVIQRIAALKPGQYTRIGAAVRHTVAQLANSAARHRLLLTDGKPNDIDHYEGRFQHAVATITAITAGFRRMLFILVNASVSMEFRLDIAAGGQVRACGSLTRGSKCSSWCGRRPQFTRFGFVPCEHAKSKEGCRNLRPFVPFKLHGFTIFGERDEIRFDYCRRCGDLRCSACERGGGWSWCRTGWGNSRRWT